VWSILLTCYKKHFKRAPSAFAQTPNLAGAPRLVLASAVRTSLRPAADALRPALTRYDTHRVRTRSYRLRAHRFIIDAIQKIKTTGLLRKVMTPPAREK